MLKRTDVSVVPAGNETPTPKSYGLQPNLYTYCATPAPSRGPIVFKNTVKCHELSFTLFLVLMSQIGHVLDSAAFVCCGKLHCEAGTFLSITTPKSVNTFSNNKSLRGDG